MANNTDYIDYGKWKVPTKWEDLTLKQFQDIERYLNDKEQKFDIRKLIQIYTNKTEDEVFALPIDFLDLIMTKMEFLKTKPEQKEPKNSVKIKGETYTVHNENKLRVGEYVAVDTAMKGDEHNYAAMLAILCRKEGEVYDSHFENEVLEGRIKMWEETPVMDVLPLVGFFLRLYVTLRMPSQLSSVVKGTINLTRKDIETLAANGEISKHSMKSAMKKLKKLEKSISTI